MQMESDMEVRRALKWAELVAWRQLQRSARAGRLIALPHALRYFDRRCADAERSIPPAERDLWPALRAGARGALRQRCLAEAYRRRPGVSGSRR